MDTSLSIIEKISLPLQEGIFFPIQIKRDDLIDPIISGNKWRKLEYNLLQAQALKKEGVLTFGGPYSNHLIATAKAAKNEGLKSIGIVRGAELTSDSNPTLRACAQMGMHLFFMARDEYRQYTQKYSHCFKALQEKYSHFYIIPEGGKNYYGVMGCQGIVKETPNNYQHIYLAGGTGTTGAGILLGCSENTQVHVISALKGDFLREDIKSLIEDTVNDKDYTEELLQQLTVHTNAHFGGYAKVSDALFQLINTIYRETQLQLDPVYTGKAFFQLVNDINSGEIRPNDNVLFIHTGGLQGATSWKDKIDFL